MIWGYHYFRKHPYIILSTKWWLKHISYFITQFGFMIQVFSDWRNIFQTGWEKKPPATSSKPTGDLVRWENLCRHRLLPLGGVKSLRSVPGTAKRICWEKQRLKSLDRYFFHAEWHWRKCEMIVQADLRDALLLLLLLLVLVVVVVVARGGGGPVKVLGVASLGSLTVCLKWLVLTLGVHAIQNMFTVEHSCG